MNHTPEPWRWKEGEQEGIHAEVVSEDGIILLTTMVNKQDAVRVTACVNGCTGLNPAAYRECVEALKMLVEAIGLQDHRTQAVFKPRVDRATQALAHAEGRT